MKLSELLLPGEPAQAAPRSGLRLSARNAPDPSPMDSPPPGWAGARALGYPMHGEPLPMSWPSDGHPLHIEPRHWSTEQKWWVVAHAPSVNLVIVVTKAATQTEAGEAWLGMMPCRETKGIPLLLLKLPCLPMWAMAADMPAGEANGSPTCGDGSAASSGS